jgi:AAA family ATP:ADP antiporter
MSTVALPSPRNLNLADRLLAAFADVRAGERTVALLMTTNLFVLLASYYVLKTVREALILSEGGAAVKSYAAAAQAVLLLAIIPIYAAIASRVRRKTLLSGVTLFFVSHLIVFYLLSLAGVKIGVAFFVWLGIFNVLTIAQFWAFANDVYESGQGERLFPLIGIGSAAGAWAGSALAGRLFSSFSTGQMILLGAVGFLCCAVITASIQSRLRRQSASEGPLPDKLGSFRLVLGNRYLLLIAVMILLLNVVNSTGEFMLGKLIVEDAKRLIASGEAGSLELKTIIGRSYGSFFAWVSLVGLLLQLFATSRIFKHFGVRAALFALPAVALSSYGLMSVIPALGAVRLAKILENGMDYSIQNTARHALFLPLGREAKYKAKLAIDTFFWRMGDVLQAGVIAVTVHLSLPSTSLGRVNLVLVMAWFAVAIAIGREHWRLHRER